MHSTKIAVVKLKSDFTLTNDIPYLVFMGMGCLCEFFKEKWLPYIESALYYFSRDTASITDDMLEYLGRIYWLEKRDVTPMPISPFISMI